jgi:GNAT superfamily N-acetyltransferase
MFGVENRVHIRKMEPEDVDGVYLVNSMAFVKTTEEKARVRSRSVKEIERRKGRYRHFQECDPDGAWLAAVEEGTEEKVVGCAMAAVREGMWLLTIFAVDPGYRGAGIGARLLSHALAYGEGCRGAMIASSASPAAVRCYALAGFDLLPTLMASGKVRSNGVPAVRSVREGGEDDLDLAAEVDRTVRGAAHGPDLEFMLRFGGGRMLVAERGREKGYAVDWEGSPGLVAATEPGLAADLLRYRLAQGGGEDEEATVRWITAGQRWAVSAVLEARLSLSPAGPICTRGELGPLAPYLPSGPFL